jgi:hypothetical protein
VIRIAAGRRLYELGITGIRECLTEVVVDERAEEW